MQTEKNETTPPCAAVEPAARGVRVINTPDCAALRLFHQQEDMPALTASICKSATMLGGEATPCQAVTVFFGKSTIATMYIYRGRAFAIRTARAALKGAMSRLGKHRRWTANRAARKTAANEEECK